MRRLFLSAAALALTPSLAAAQTATPVAAAPDAVDPAKLAVAREVVAKLLPPGVYKEMMGENFEKMMDAMMGSMGDMRFVDLVRVTGLSEAELLALGDARISEVMEIYDPHWKERLKAMTGGMGGAMGDLMVEMEPAMREGLALAYAREFSLAELTEMNRFFSTPAGSRYAARSMALFMSPEMIKAMADMMPMMMERMPAIIADLEASTKDIPPPRKISELDPKDRARLAELLGIDESKLTDSPETEEATPLEEPQ